MNLMIVSNVNNPGQFEISSRQIGKDTSFEENSNQQLFHYSTIKDEDGKIYSNSGRVLSSTVLNTSLKEARKIALKILDEIEWENKYYRRDIGFRIIDK